MGKLKTWADAQTPYIKLEDGGHIIGQYMGFRMKQSSFDPKQEVVSYLLLVDGEEKYFESGAGKVARAFDDLAENAMVKIVRTGVGPKTKYEVTEVDPKSLG